MSGATPNVDDYIRKLVACARALPQKNWEWGMFTRPGGAPIETVDHLCEAQEYSARQSDVAELWGVNYGPDTPVVCFTGNGPTSEKHAQYFAAVQPGALIWLLDDVGGRIEALEAALRRVKQELTIPAAEYVPAIPAVWEIIDAALERPTAPGMGGGL